MLYTLQTRLYTDNNNVTKINNYEPYILCNNNIHPRMHSHRNLTKYNNRKL